MKRTDLIAAGIIFALILFSIYNLSRSGAAESRDFGEKIAVLPLDGVIIDSRPFIEDLDELASRQNVKGILLRINSPGGGTTASEEIYLALLRVKKKYNKPVFAAISTMGASGAYYAALAADRIYSTSTSLTGSIGVIIDLPQWTRLMDQLGLDMNRFRSGDLKGAGSPYREMSPAEKNSFQLLVDDVYDGFIHRVADHRSMTLEQVRPLARGQAFTGRQALEYGLVDEIGSLQDALDSLSSQLGLGENPKLIYPRKDELSLFELLFSDVQSLFSKLHNSPTLQMIYK